MFNILIKCTIASSIALLVQNLLDLIFQIEFKINGLTVNSLAARTDEGIERKLSSVGFSQVTIFT